MADVMGAVGGISSMAGAAVGGGVSFGSGLATSILNTKSAVKEYKYMIALTKAQMRADKAIAERNISLTQDEGMRSDVLIGKNAAKIEGAQKATSAGMGIGGGSVTTANLLEDTRIQSNLDKMAVRYQADLQSWKIQNQLNYDQYASQVRIDQYNYAMKSARHNMKMSIIGSTIGFLFTAGGQLGSAQSASGFQSILDSAGGQPKPMNNPNVTTSMMNNPANHAPAGYYQTGGTKVPQYLSVNS